MIKESVFQNDITILNMYVPNNRASKYERQKPTELQGEIDIFIVIGRDLISLLSEMDITSRKNFSKT